MKLNFVMNALLTMSSILFPLITFPYISRVLLPAGTGKVNFAISVVAYFTLFAQLGIPTYGIRICAQVRDDRQKLSQTVQELMAISFIMCALSCLLLGLGIAFVPRLRADRALFLVSGSAILLNTIGAEWLYKGLEQYTYITVRSLIFKVIALVAMFLMVHQQSDYVIYAGITVFASYASYILNFLNLRKYVSLRPTQKLNLRRHMKAVLAFFAMSCATTIYTNLDTVMLELMKGDVEVGYYSAAVKVKNVLVSVITSLGTVLLPRASYYIEHGQKEQFHRIAQKALHFVMLIAPAMMVYFILFAKESIYLLSGTAFEGSILPMQVIMPTILLIGLTNIMGIQMLIPLGQERIVLYSEIAGAVVDLIVNALLIPKFASTGAAVGTLVAEAVVLAVQYVALRGTLKTVIRQMPYGSVLAALAAGTAACIWVKMLHWGSFLTLAVSAVVFFGGYLLVLTLMREKLTLEIETQMADKIGARHFRKSNKG